MAIEGLRAGRAPTPHAFDELVLAISQLSDSRARAPAATKTKQQFQPRAHTGPDAAAVLLCLLDHDGRSTWAANAYSCRVGSGRSWYWRSSLTWPAGALHRNAADFVTPPPLTVGEVAHVASTTSTVHSRFRRSMVVASTALAAATVTVGVVWVSPFDTPPAGKIPASSAEHRATAADQCASLVTDKGGYTDVIDRDLSAELIFSLGWRRETEGCTRHRRLRRSQGTPR